MREIPQKFYAVGGNGTGSPSEEDRRTWIKWEKMEEDLAAYLFGRAKKLNAGELERVRPVCDQDSPAEFLRRISNPGIMHLPVQGLY